MKEDYVYHKHLVSEHFILMNILRIVTLTKGILIHIKVKCSERTNHPTHTKEHSFIQFIHTLEKNINYGVGEL